MTAENKQTMLEFSKIKFAYKAQSALVLDDFSMKILQGETTAVLGPNGTGKTTMLMLSLGWLSPASGLIELDGRSVSSYGRRELGRKIAIVQQSERFSFDFSLLDFVLFGRAPYLGQFAQPSAADCGIALEAIKRVGLSGKENDSILASSGGERQLMLLARALAQQPDILLLDEPTSHLDIKNKSRLIGILRGLIAEGKTIVLTTHEPDVAGMIANSVIMIKNGRVMRNGSVNEIMTGENLTELYDTGVYTVEHDSHRVYFWQ